MSGRLVDTGQDWDTEYSTHGLTLKLSKNTTSPDVEFLEKYNIMLKKRIQGLLWHTGMMIVAVLIDYAIDNLTGLNLSSTITVILGLILGQISKAIHDYILETS